MDQSFAVDAKLNNNPLMTKSLNPRTEKDKLFKFISVLKFSLIVLVIHV